LSDEPLPLRLFYIGSVYRSGESYKSARKKEFTQAGVELIGANTPEADAEVIALTINSLLSCGLSDFQIELAHSDFLQGIINDCSLSEEDENLLRSLLDKKFAIGIEEFCDSHSISGINREILTELPSIFGDGGKVLAKYRSLSLNAASEKAIAQLDEVYSILCDYNMEKYITVDLGQIRSFKYYTGVIFRGLTANSAFPICGGGRYDTLCKRFNLDLPATGAAIWLDRLADALLRSNLAGDISTSPDAIIFYSPSRRAEAFEKATSLREEGKRVVLDILSLEKDEAKESAQKRGIKEIYTLEDIK
jgi:ATP phosphoribosyltransferase regulatory subunit